MSAAHTPGPWKAHFEEAYFVTGPDFGRVAMMMNLKGAHGLGGRRSGDESAANARLIAAAPELLEALRECVDAMWQVDSHSVVFDSTVLFGPSYDFSGIDGPRREEFLAEHCCIVWPSGGIGASKWSAYCTFDGSLWFERFATATEAKEQCMRLLDKVMPAHPAMKARAAIANATGGAQ